MAGHKTTVILRPNVWLRLRNKSERDGVAVSQLVNDLLEQALMVGGADAEPVSLGAGASDVDDLGTNSRKYLRELVR